MKLKEMKNKSLEKSKDMIQNIYEELEVRKLTKGELSQLTNINAFLSKGVKDRFLQMQSHAKLNMDISELNCASVAFYEQVKTYKFDMAQNLQKLFECYNAIFVKQYNTFFLTENVKEKTILEKLDTINEKKVKLDKWSDQLQKKQEMIKNLLDCKDR